MATPTTDANGNFPPGQGTPGSEPPAFRDTLNSYTVTLHFNNVSPANMATDWTTLTGTNFASANVVASWKKS